MAEIGRFDTSVPGGMFVEKEKSLDHKTLIFWRGLAESGRFGRKPEGPPSGEIALAVSIQSSKTIEDILKPRQQRQTIMEGQD